MSQKEKEAKKEEQTSFITIIETAYKELEAENTSLPIPKLEELSKYETLEDLTEEQSETLIEQLLAVLYASIPDVVETAQDRECHKLCIQILYKQVQSPLIL